MSEREAAIAYFLADTGWLGAERVPLAGDASFRKYDRLRDGERRAVLMDAPPPMEDVRPFVRIANHLQSLSFSVPTVLAADEEAGLLLLDDLGDDTYTRLLRAGADEGALYRLAVDTLIALHRHPVAEAVPHDLPLYDEAKFLEEAALLSDWFLPARGIAVEREEYLDLWRAVYGAACDVPPTMVLRDFHVDNLMKLDRAGVRGCGLLDFQDALRGPVTYDLMSLMEDARRDIDTALADKMKAHYLQAFPDIAPDAFAKSWAIWAAQRHAKVIGIFTRLNVRDGKPIYLEHIPRVWRLLERALIHPVLEPLLVWFERHVPKDKRS